MIIQRVEHNQRRTRLQVHVCEGPFERARGLLFRHRLDAGSAYLLRPCRAVHTFGMTYAIDVLFCTPRGVVLGIVRNLPPWRVVRDLDAHAVWELPGGAAWNLGISVGDRLVPCA